MNIRLHLLRQSPTYFLLLLLSFLLKSCGGEGDPTALIEPIIPTYEPMLAQTGTNAGQSLAVGLPQQQYLPQNLTITDYMVTDSAPLSTHYASSSSSHSITHHLSLDSGSSSTSITTESNNKVKKRKAATLKEAARSQEPPKKTNKD